MQTLSSHAVTVQRIRLLVCGGLLFFIGGLLLYFFLWLGILWLSLSFFFTVTWLFFYIPAYCRSVSVTIEDNTLLIQKGVLLRRMILIGRDRVQYVHMIVTPAARIYKTASLLFLLAGQTVWLGELDRDQAQQLLEDFADETVHAQDTSAGDSSPP